jgi:uncharacterized membrane protein YjjP (DUF1212 family)
MNESFDIKKTIPYIAAILIFIGITLFYFKPLIGGSKQLQQSDFQHYRGMSKEIMDYRDKTGGKEALWTNSMFGGMPAYQISVIYHGNLLKYVNSILMLGLPHPAGYVFLYMLGFFILLMALRVDPWVGIVGAIAFGFSSYFFIIIEAGHNSKAHAIGLMAPVVAGFILTYRGKYLIGGAITALFLGLELFANHLQITYYMGIFLVIYCLAEGVSALINKKAVDFFKSSAVIAVAGILAVLPNITNIWATYEYGKYTTRGKSELTINEKGKTDMADKTDGLDRSYATGWSYGRGETMTLMIPNFKGGGSESIGTHHADAMKDVPSELQQYVGQMDGYFGDQPFTSGPVYAGAIVIFLFVLGLFIVKGPLKWAILIATILSILLSWGSNYMGFSNFFFDHVPGYNKFRAVSMILVIAEFTLPLLAILALDQVLKTSDFFGQKVKAPFINFYLENKKAFFVAVGLTGGLCLLFLVAPGFNDFFKTQGAYDGKNLGEREQIYSQVVKSGGAEVANQLVDGLESARKSIFKKDVWRSLIFIGLAACLLFFYFKNTIQKSLVIAGFGLFILVDMALVDWRYLNDASFVPKVQVQIPYQPSEADLQILEDKDPDFRVLNVAVNTFNDASTSYFHKSIGGYHGAKLKRYQELIEFQISKNNQSVLNMLNTKYVIIADKNQTPVVQQNPNALGNAWFVNEYKLVPNADSEIVALSHFDPAHTAIIDKRFTDDLGGLKPAKDSLSRITLTHYEPNDLTYESNNKGEGLAVFSEIYYKDGWNAYVNGKLVPHLRADYVLRAMRLPAGKNQIEFKFEPAVFKKGEKISLAGSVLLLLVCAGSAFLAWKKK